jgi:hypothetical protein
LIVAIAGDVAIGVFVDMIVVVKDDAAFAVVVIIRNFAAVRIGTDIGIGIGTCNRKGVGTGVDIGVGTGVDIGAGIGVGIGAVIGIGADIGVGVGGSTLILTRAAHSWEIRQQPREPILHRVLNQEMIRPLAVLTGKKYIYH